jgi:hypothetical protein
MNWLTCHKQLLQLAETREILTTSQIISRDSLLNAVEMWEKHINLWGNPGTGKTFLTHFLHHRADLLYFPNASRYDATVSRDSVIAIDNAPHTRQEARGLYDRIRWGQKDYTGPRSVILITRQPIDDDIRKIELTLTDADIAHIENIIRQQFVEYDFETVSQYAQQCSGLWGYVKTLTQRAK